MAGEILFEGSGLRITADALTARGKTWPMAEVAALEETGFWSARAALAASVVVMAVIAGSLASGPLHTNWIFYAFIGSWVLLVLMLAYAGFALKGLRLRTAARRIALPGRFTRKELAGIAAAFAQAKAGQAR